jgi:Phosphoenolpyruvate-protein kinase (PTS system EI component in bacteria)
MPFALHSRSWNPLSDPLRLSSKAIFQFPEHVCWIDEGHDERRFASASIQALARHLGMNQVVHRYSDQLSYMKDNPYMQLLSVDILDASRRVINIITYRPRMWLALDHPVILAAERLMPTDLFSVPSGMILGIITAEVFG